MESLTKEDLNYYKNLFKSACLQTCHVGSGQRCSMPDWFDLQKFEIGVKFFKRHSFSIGLCGIESNLSLTRYSATRKVLKMTGKR